MRLHYPLAYVHHFSRHIILLAMGHDATIYIFLFLGIQKILNGLLPLCLCDSQTINRTGKTDTQKLFRTNVLLRNTTRELSQRDDATINISTLKTGAFTTRVDGAVSSPVHNSTVRSFVSGAGIPKPKRRQGDPGEPNPDAAGGGGFNKQMADVEAANRFTTVHTTTIILKRTTPPREVFEEQCDYIAHYCLRTYQTGRLCGRTIYHNYTTFKNYCMLDYVNCMERYEMWQLVHMGQCYNLKTITEYIHYGYHEDKFLDEDYVPDDQEFGLIG